MFDFYEKRKIRSIIYSKITIGLLFVIFIFLCMSAYDRFVAERQMYAQKEAKEAQLDSLKQRAEVLKQKVHHLKSSRGIEEELRNRFDVAKEGEQVVVIVDEDRNAATSTETTEENEKGAGGNSVIDWLIFW